MLLLVAVAAMVRQEREAQLNPSTAGVPYPSMTDGLSMTARQRQRLLVLVVIVGDGGGNVHRVRLTHSSTPTRTQDGWFKRNYLIEAAQMASWGAMLALGIKVSS